MEITLKKELLVNDILNSYLKCDDSDIGGMKISVALALPWEEVEEVEGEIEKLKTAPQKSGTDEFYNIVKNAVAKMFEELWLTAKSLSD